MRLRPIAGATMASVLAADGGLHTFWAVTGSPWPAPDHRTLSAALLDRQVPFTPPVLVPLAVLLFGGAALVAARAGLLGATGRRLPHWLPYLATLAVTGGIAVRAVAGLGWLFAADPATAFFALNLALYTPLCLLLGAAGLVLLRRERRDRWGRSQAGRRPDARPANGTPPAVSAGRPAPRTAGTGGRTPGRE
ncbi:hypothetical protein Athai_09570 [Actinocatenispora thailandica]|uniref:DUF3995 domain-containing protein n=1 Tax=Actinocatenispora thailandica TaxID=227318 RepID=A0A7R7HW02_9ACTN|nr:DUF3995 domain-containing protein [Actinocatenispora thailandica]BCJ33454.1 hypothetical protein Athai_09570 [Actinocatenispora thailandica]